MAKRVVDIMAYFAEGRREATVMEIARRYDWPQSSTSELIDTLVDLGMLYRTHQSRRFYPSPRMSALGSGVEAEPTNGRLFDYMHSLARSRGFGVGLFGMTNVSLNVLHWRHSAKLVRCNLTEPPLLASTVVGQLLLSTLEPNLLDRVLWRLRAEVGPTERIDTEKLSLRIREFGFMGWAAGPSCISPKIDVCATLLPETFGENRLVLGAYYPAALGLRAHELIDSMQADIASLLPEVNRSTPLGSPAFTSFG